ncbi:MAG: hypothetical protein IIY94_05640 [Oscillospiraceae bacterium]|nr:hypothetical protein [Oscillospiraceae bacterium]
MKELKKLDRHIRWSECFHLSLITLYFAFLINLITANGDEKIRILLALGTVIPAQLIRFLCAHIEKKRFRLLASLGVMGVTIFLTWKDENWACYLLACLPILISGIFLPRSKDRILITVPSPYALIFAFLSFALGKAVEGLGVPYVADLSLALTALMTINFFLYLNLTRLAWNIRMSADAEVSVSSMVRQNRKVIVCYLVIGCLILTAIPFLLQKSPQREPIEMIVEETGVIPVETAAEQKDERVFTSTPEGERELHLDWLNDLLSWTLVLGALSLAFFGGILGIRTLLEKTKTKKLMPPTVTDGLVVERLDEKETKQKKEKLSGWEKKIRRRYEKLILGRAPCGERLYALTPAELETVAKIADKPENAALHALYEQTRYGTGIPTKEDYQRFKDYAKALEK